VLFVFWRSEAAKTRQSAQVGIKCVADTNQLNSRVFFELAAVSQSL